jgi:hypothetical protein
MENEEFQEQMRRTTREYVKKMILPQLSANLEEAVIERLDQLDVDSELSPFVFQLGSLANDYRNGVIFSPYPLITPDNGNRLKDLTKIDRYSVENNGGYDYFGEAINDFLVQSDVGKGDLAKLARVSPISVINFTKNSPKVHPDNFTNLHKKYQFRARDKILGIFDIKDNGEMPVNELPLYGEDCNPRG